MKAKELKDKAATIDYINDTVPVCDGYEFTLHDFQSFCEQLCKEQRENVLKASNFSSDFDYYFATQEDILNAKMPDL